MTPVAPADTVPRLPRWLANQPFRRQLALMVGVPSLIALLGMALSLARVLEIYRRSQVLDHANTSSNHLLLAAATQAKERGFTAAVLADPGASRAAAQIASLRATGDGELAAALAAAAPAMHGNRVLEASFLRLQGARHERDRARTSVDETLRQPARTTPAEPAFVQGWFEAQTRLILAENEFGKALFIAQNPFELVLQYNGDIKARCFLASEFAGRERAQIARVIASGRPIPPETLAELQRWRGVVEENLAAIAQLRANPLMPENLVGRIGEMEVAFLGDYERVRRSVYEAGTGAAGRPYPLGADAWIEEATRAIDRILAVSTQIGEEAARISRQQETASLGNFLFIAGLLGALLLALGVAAVIGRGLIRRVRELRAGAERVAAGDMAHPVPAGGADELGTLADAFNAMTAEVRAGLERLRAEKLSVEVKVRERTLELSEANAHLRALDEEKNAFLGICSHDLKNPLGAILSLADFIRETPGTPPEARAHARDIRDSAEFMLALVVNLLNVAAIEAGRFPMRLEPLDLRVLAGKAVETFRDHAEKKRIRLALQGVPERRQPAVAPPATAGAEADGGDGNHDDASALVVGDRHALVQVLDNLISNAVKYSPPGGTVQVQLTRQGETLRLAVADSGPGLSVRDQAKLFGKFARLSSRPTGGEHSAGLGLSIVKRLVEAMRGRVWCESELGHGATFLAELPTAVAVR